MPVPVSVLPPHLAERCETASIGSTSEQPPEFVLYWLRTALRVDENPALDTARILASEMGLPLLVYHGLSERYRFASDRHHTFILEGARDLQTAFQLEKLDYAFHLEREGHRQDCLKQLAERAAVIVTEDMPTDAPRAFLSALKRHAPGPILLVDTACVAPMRLVGRAYERAFEFRNRTKKLYAERIPKEWPLVSVPVKRLDHRQLGFTPIDLQNQAISELVAECEIDHTIGPVPDTAGGSLAGYARWDAFCRGRLTSYAKQRNDPLREGSSRMSAYLHYGMVSPFRLARQAKAAGNGGAEKYLDELLIWRELAYCFCKFRPDYSRWAALPDWARESLQAHAADTRPDLYSWEQLARGQTSDELWNATQRSLLVNGELHNNVRMTWGKALLNWRKSPREALTMLLDLNHRFALDGRDPASYGGILWCLGQFDRPFTPPQPVFGTVRTRPTEVHAQRLDVAKYSRLSGSSRFRPVRIAVVGAGLAGSMAARTLSDHGLDVTVFEKSRGAGGRMSTRSTEHGEFDHGAQYFTARDARFRRYVKAWQEQHLVATWPGPFVSFDEAEQPQICSRMERFVAVPQMNRLAKHLSHGLPMVTGVQVAHVRRKAEQLELQDAEGASLGEFDRVVVSAPAPQTAHMLAEFEEMVSPLQAVVMQPCWAAMISLANELACDWSGAFVNAGPLRWMARNATKPGRASEFENLVLHASPTWSEQHLEDTPEAVGAALLEAFWKITGIPRVPVRYQRAHRWRYSIPTETCQTRCLASRDGKVVAGGDWAGGPRVEGAFLSGSAMAGRILGSLTPASHANSGQLALF